ncbi:hypothetical protein P7C70_g8800, partial [Phenoliferia sp. Uapishka_3]
LPNTPAPLAGTYSESYTDVQSNARTFNGGLESPLDESPFTSPWGCDQSDFDSPAWHDTQTPDLGLDHLSLFTVEGAFTGSLFPAMDAEGQAPSSQATVVPQEIQGDIAVGENEEKNFDLGRHDDGSSIPDTVKAEAVDIANYAGPFDVSEQDQAAVEDSADDYVPPARDSRSRKRKVSATPCPRDVNTGKRVYNGTRNNLPLLTASDPIQSRKYSAPSTTSRKPLPKAIVKTALRQGFKIDEGAEQPTEEVAAFVEDRRAQNTIAARKSRERKARHLSELEQNDVAQKELIEHQREEIEHLRGENGRLRKRMRTAGLCEE